MSVKKLLTGLIISLAMIIVITTLGSLRALAESDVVRQSIEVELNDDYFNPNVITVPVGKTTTLILKNQGNREHTFTVKKLGIDAEVPPEKEKSITVKPETPGTYELICRFHYLKGMVGKVIVK
ncbi:cupredoxin domain-containing protein [Bacillus cereus group sp. N12]|uniref:cupredoxin domain-containing protein n=1 Tax=Bacillus cereus group sp. N12 TaxID=2794586 RepID=UPI0018F4D1AC|nr:cupredoxin domain-containing protein [Bacillus cereus group sp. N12]MBJ8074997.1 cupredoxin domain-containing protein [Bacillus cereus group sp. N12]